MDHEALEHLADIYRDADNAEPARMAALGRLLESYASAPTAEGRRAAGGLVYSLLQPLAAGIAGRAAHHLPARQRDEFVADALVHVFAAHGRQGVPRICLFDISGSTPGRLVCWLQQVIRRLLQSVRRTNRRRPIGADLPRDVPSTDPGPDAAAEAGDPFWAAPLRRADIDALHAVPATLRVRLVAVTGAWLRLPDGVWESWLGEYEAGRGLALGRPCPPASLLASDNVHQFFQGLAESLGTTVGALNGVRYQQLPRFRQVLEYLHGGDDPIEAGPRTEDAGRPGALSR